MLALDYLRKLEAVVRNYGEYKDVKLYAAIVELEALQKPNSCFNCKHLRPAVTRGRCSNCVRIAVDRYEPKEQ